MLKSSVLTTVQAERTARYGRSLRSARTNAGAGEDARGGSQRPAGENGLPGTYLAVS